MMEAKELKTARRNKKLTQHELGVLLGWKDGSRVSRIEKGEIVPNKETWDNIAKILAIKEPLAPAAAEAKDQQAPDVPVAAEPEAEEAKTPQPSRKKKFAPASEGAESPWQWNKSREVVMCQREPGVTWMIPVEELKSEVGLFRWGGFLSAMDWGSNAMLGGLLRQTMEIIGELRDSSSKPREKKKPVGEAIREERQRQEIALEEMARRIGLDDPQILEQIEMGQIQPDRRTLYRIGSVLEVHPLKLLSVPVEEKPQQEEEASIPLADYVPAPEVVKVLGATDLFPNIPPMMRWRLDEKMRALTYRVEPGITCMVPLDEIKTGAGLILWLEFLMRQSWVDEQLFGQICLAGAKWTLVSRERKAERRVARTPEALRAEKKDDERSEETTEMKSLTEEAG